MADSADNRNVSFVDTLGITVVELTRDELAVIRLIRQTRLRTQQPRMFVLRVDPLQILINCCDATERYANRP